MGAGQCPGLTTLWGPGGQSCEGVAGEGFPGLLGGEGANRGARPCPLNIGVGDAHKAQQVSRHASGNVEMRASLTHAHAHTVA